MSNNMKQQLEGAQFAAKQHLTTVEAQAKCIASLRAELAAAPAPILSGEVAEFDLAKMLRKAYNYGQTYWQQADSDYASQHKKSEETAVKFSAFVLESVEAFAALAAVPAMPAKPIDQQLARWAIDGAILKGRTGEAAPPTADHWLMEYWMIGQQLSKLGETSPWDNMTPVDAPAMPAQVQQPSAAQLIAQLHDDEKWTVAEQQQFAAFLVRFPNESSQGIISLGSAWKHGKSSGTPAQPIADVSAASDEPDVAGMFFQACADLGAISEALGLDPDDGGADPIIEAIEELRHELVVARNSANGSDTFMGEPVIPARADVSEMVNRFLGWSLPKTFAPDCGISFKPLGHPNGWPIGTNLLTAVEARAMFEHCAARTTPASGQAAQSQAVAVQTWQSRTTDGKHNFATFNEARDAEIADLRAALAQTQANSDDISAHLGAMTETANNWKKLAKEQIAKVAEFGRLFAKKSGYVTAAAPNPPAPPVRELTDAGYGDVLKGGA